MRASARAERAGRLARLLGLAETVAALQSTSADRTAGEPWDDVPLPAGVFDPDRGASGRPKAFGEYVPGETRVGRALTVLRKGKPGKTFGSWVRLFPGEFELGDARDETVRRLPIAAAATQGRKASKGVAELVWFEAEVPLHPHPTFVFHHRSLLFLDGAGIRLAVFENCVFSETEVFQLAHAAGVPAAAYRFTCSEREATLIRDLMFPGSRHEKRM